MNGGGLHVAWDLSRAAGITAMVLLSLAVGAGLIRPKRSQRPLEARALHEVLSLAALLMIGIHGLALLADPWLQPGVTGIAVPFASGYRPLWTGMGIVAAYGALALGPSYYLRRWIGPGRWRRLHRLVALFWLMALGHALGSGSDAGSAWFQGLLALTAAPALLLLVLRHAVRADEARAPVSLTHGDAGAS